MKKYLVFLTVLVTACVGCQPKEQDDSLVQKDRIEPPVAATPEPVREISGTVGVGAETPETAGKETPVPDVEPEATSEETALPAEDVAAVQETVTAAPEASETAPGAVPPADKRTPADESVEKVTVTPTERAEGSVKEASEEAGKDLEEPDGPELVGPRIYAAYKDLLSAYVDKNGNVDYGTLRRKRGDLYGIVRDFDNLDPREYLPWGRNEKIAFWLNAYNIFTLKVVIDNYPIESSWAKVMLNYPKNSIVHISDPWTKKYFKVLGLEYTLREIERAKLVEQYGDLRVCLALTYASMGGAMLRNEPFYPDKLDEQLDDQVRRFVADSRGFEIDRVRGTVYLADIFNWYKPNFIGKYGAVRKFRDKPQHIQAYLNFIVNYLGSEDVRYLETQSYTVEFRKYDWRLNEQPNK